MNLLVDPALAAVVDGSSLLRRGTPLRAAVARVQEALAALGLALTADGAFGPGTEARVREFQRWAGIADDGVIGSTTLHAIADAVERGATLPVAPPPPPSRVLDGNARFGDRVALSFDDGPHPSRTPQVLDILAAEGAVATFYVLGERVRSHPEIVRRAVAEGHAIGNHSWDHPDLGKLDAAQVRSQVDRCHAAVVDATGEGPTSLRPPYGSPFFGGSSARKERVTDACAAHDYPCVLWTVDTRDWAHASDPDAILEELDDQLRAGRGGVVLMHDIHAQSVKVLPGVIAKIRERGFRIVPLKELLDERFGTSPLA